MIGTYDVRVSRRRGTSFKFSVRRNITVVRGDSATGKTTLYEMIADHTRLGEASGVTVQCDKPCVALTDIDWRNQLRNTSGSIVFVDEGPEEIRKPDFARAVRESDNYYVIFTRVELPNLPYSVDEVYRIKTSGMYHELAPMYKKGDGCRYSLSRRKPRNDFGALVTEGSKSGLQFFQRRLESGDVRCETAQTNSAVIKWMLDHVEESIFVIADGAAFGPYVDRVLKLQAERPDSIAVCLPESFEWLLLKSGVVSTPEIAAILENPSSYIESADFFSWEQFFTNLLQSATKESTLAYREDKLAEGYMDTANADKVMALIACRNIR